MGAHWRVAFRSAAWMVVLAVLIEVAILYVYGVASAGAFGYGVGVGLISFVSTAVTVSLISGVSKAAGVLLGMLSFGVRYGFVAGALGVPAYLGIGPVAAMVAGFAAVYFVETVMLVPWAVRAEAPSVAEGVERRSRV
ncbi:MAG: hypothetical protein M3317_13505 [Actinomycetota bacterium]|nr:hypothetical protein [Actinomycetota bacterium]